MDETYIKINGQWNYHYRAVYKNGQTIDFLFPHRDKPDKVTIDKSGANRAALEAKLAKRSRFARSGI